MLLRGKGAVPFSPGTLERQRDAVRMRFIRRNYAHADDVQRIVNAVVDHVPIGVQRPIRTAAVRENACTDTIQLTVVGFIFCPGKESDLFHFFQQHAQLGWNRRIVRRNEKDCIASSQALVQRVRRIGAP